MDTAHAPLDFSLVLATIGASVANFLKLPETDLNFEDLAGEGDEHENLQDDAIADDSTIASESASPTKNSGVSTPLSSVSTNTSSTATSHVKNRKKPGADSWDDEADQEDADDEEEDVNAG